MDPHNRWRHALPRPVAFVLSGGASLGAIQVGMLEALAQAGIQPDLVVGTSVGALNGAVLGDQPIDQAVGVLKEAWIRLTRQDIFPGGVLSQARQLLATRVSLFPQDRLGELICRVLTVERIEHLQRPFGALATELLTHQGTLFTSGPIRPALLASAAIPGIYPPVLINGTLYVDGALASHVPLLPAVRMGAASLVVLDAGNTCYRRQPPKQIAEVVAASIHAALRSRVRVEAPALALRYPILYMPTPCPITQSLLDFDHTADLISQAADLAAAFLEGTPIPIQGAMSGSPHFHSEPQIITHVPPSGLPTR